MKVLQLSVGLPKIVEFNGNAIRTSIFKSPITGYVAARWHNLDGDKQSDLAVHGGRDKAIYVYSSDYYSEWARVLGTDSLETSQFGENLTVSGCRDTETLIGARLRIGSAEVTVTQPRIPCFKPGIRLGDRAFPKTFWKKGRLGFYLRVEQEGLIASGNSVEILQQPKHDITIRKLYEIVTHSDHDGAKRALDELGHLDSGWIRRLRHVAKAENAAEMVPGRQ